MGAGGPSTIPRLLPVLPGRGGSWPFSGCFYGLVDDGDPEGPWAAWAGRIGPPSEGGVALEAAWRTSRAVHRALLRGGLPSTDRRKAIAGLLARLDPALPLPHGVLGGVEPDELVLLLVTADRDGVALTGTGLGGVVAIGGGERWVEPPHPLLTVRGLPGARTGALSLTWEELGKKLPRWLVALPAGETFEAVPQLRARCGVDVVLP